MTAFRSRIRFGPDVVVSLDDVFDQKIDALHEFESQFYEGGANGSEDLVGEPAVGPRRGRPQGLAPQSLRAAVCRRGQSLSGRPGEMVRCRQRRKPSNSPKRLSSANTAAVRRRMNWRSCFRSSTSRGRFNAPSTWDGLPVGRASQPVCVRRPGKAVLRKRSTTAHAVRLIPGSCPKFADVFAGSCVRGFVLAGGAAMVCGGELGFGPGCSGTSIELLSWQPVRSESSRQIPSSKTHRGTNRTPSVSFSPRLGINEIAAGDPPDVDKRQRSTSGGIGS